MPLKEGVVTTQPKSAQKQKGLVAPPTGRQRKSRSVSPRGDTAHVRAWHRPASASPPRSPSYVERQESIPRSSSLLQVSHLQQALSGSSRSTSLSLDRSRSPSPDLPARSSLPSVRKWLAASRSPSPEPVVKHKLSSASASAVPKREGSSEQSGESEGMVISNIYTATVTSDCISLDKIHS